MPAVPKKKKSEDIVFNGAFSRFKISEVSDLSYW